MSQYLLSVSDLLAMKPGTIFAHGAMQDNALGLNMTGTDQLLTWVAKRGDGYHDWAIYCDWYRPSQSLIEIARHGQKIHNLDTVKRLVPYDEEAKELYRR